MTDQHNKSPPANLSGRFNRYRFLVDCTIDPQAYLEQSPGATLGAQGALEAEILSNLESLPGVLDVKVEPA